MYVVYFTVNYPMPTKPIKKTIYYRNISNISITNFLSDLHVLILNDRNDITMLNLNNCLSHLLSTHSPQKTKHIIDPNNNHWFNSENIRAKKHLRKAERCFSKNQTENNKIALIEASTTFKESIKMAKISYYHNKIVNCGNIAKLLYNVSDSIMGKTKEKILPDIISSDLCNQFSSFFTNKIEIIRQTIYNLICIALPTLPYTPPSISFLLSSFTPPSTDYIELLILSSKSSSPLDSIPLSLMKKIAPALSIYLITIFKNSLSYGTVPIDFKHALISPILKKNNLDKNSLCNYRPISQLSTISKILEKVVFKQLIYYLEINNIIDPFQSAYRPNHNTEKCLNHVISNILNSLDTESPIQLLLLDLSAAFDTLDHDILTNRLRDIGVDGIALSWLISFFKYRTFAVKTGSSISITKLITTGVPQGSVLGPLLFLIYIAPLTNIIKSYPSIHYHLYADDILLYTSLSRHSTSNRNDLSLCATEIRAWLLNNMLLLNASKSELINIPETYYDFPVISVNGIIVEPSSSIRYLGFTIDDDLTFKKQINNICQRSNYQLHMIRNIRKYINNDLCRILVNSLAMSPIDYCCSILQGLPECRIRPLTRIIRSSVRLIFKQPRTDHSSITLKMKSIKMLSMKQRTLYRQLCIVHKSLLTAKPQYINEMLKPKLSTRTLRSTDDRYLLSSDRCRLSRTLNGAFVYSAPLNWNQLPLSIRMISNHDAFKRNVKKYILAMR